jgi:hypothetical protein
LTGAASAGRGRVIPAIVEGWFLREMCDGRDMGDGKEVGG